MLQTNTTWILTSAILMKLLKVEEESVLKITRKKWRYIKK
jgi:hypothetical protein